MHRANYDIYHVVYNVYTTVAIGKRASRKRLQCEMTLFKDRILTKSVRCD